MKAVLFYREDVLIMNVITGTYFYFYFYLYYYYYSCQLCNNFFQCKLLICLLLNKRFCVLRIIIFIFLQTKKSENM